MDVRCKIKCTQIIWITCYKILDIFICFLAFTIPKNQTIDEIYPNSSPFYTLLNRSAVVTSVHDASKSRTREWGQLGSKNRFGKDRALSRELCYFF